MFLTVIVTYGALMAVALKYVYRKTLIRCFRLYRASSSTQALR